LKEAQSAPNPLTATEMVLVRLAYVADLPGPAELVERLTNGGGTPPQSEAPAPTAAAPTPSTMVSTPPRMDQATAPDLAVDDVPQAKAGDSPVHLADFKAVAHLAKQHKELALYSDLVAAVHVVKFEQGTIEIRVGGGAHRSVANRLSTKLSEWTGRKWVVVVSNEPGAPTLSQQEADLQAQRLAQAAENPVVKAVLDAFPGSKIAQVRDGSAAEKIDQDKEN
jgi:DNA polymerase-3 subunit gamma/tau